MSHFSNGCSVCRRRGGLRSRFCGFAGRGFERLKQGDIELILLDLGLGESEGLDTFRRVAERAPDVAIIVFSGAPMWSWPSKLSNWERRII
jgi:DNA-binding NarL/FixJ family response regulator